MNHFISDCPTAQGRLMALGYLSPAAFTRKRKKEQLGKAA